MSAPLSPASERETLHFRDYAFSGHRRTDGLFDIEGRMVDRKSYAFPNDWRGTVEAGEPVHEMLVRVTLDERLVIQGVEAVTSASPFAVCGAITPVFSALKGERIKPGWSELLKRRFGGRAGCTHHVEMLRALGTVAFQTVHGWRERQRRERSEARLDGPPHAQTRDEDGGPSIKRPGFIDTCHALAADGEIVRRHYPQFYEPSIASNDKDKA